MLKVLLNGSGCMQTYCLFDWPAEKAYEMYKMAALLLRSHFGNNVRCVLSVDGKSMAGETLPVASESRFSSAKVSASIEMYSGVLDVTDPEYCWTSYLCCGFRRSGTSELIFSTKDDYLDRNFITALTKRFSEFSNLGYGFCFAKGGVDGRYFARGISTTESTREQREDDSRWFNERLVFSGGGAFKTRRHLNGWFKDVFEFNVISLAHVNNLRLHVGSTGGAGDLVEMSNDVFLWMPSHSGIKKVKGLLKENGLVI